jgi:hypothetical protein
MLQNNYKYEVLGAHQHVLRVLDTIIQLEIDRQDNSLENLAKRVAYMGIRAKVSELTKELYTK